ncbi:Uncharacterized protein Fot_50598 [Forsythia ovata]|uniref:Uncharacterized protein n=1 Tax=Forsythia ovata TaxID=205694 RepID=A0ABD1PYL5_9LAMI
MMKPSCTVQPCQTVQSWLHNVPAEYQRKRSCTKQTSYKAMRVSTVNIRLIRARLRNCQKPVSPNTLNKAAQEKHPCTSLQHLLVSKHKETKTFTPYTHKIENA